MYHALFYILFLFTYIACWFKLTNDTFPNVFDREQRALPQMKSTDFVTENECYSGTYKKLYGTRKDMEMCTTTDNNLTLTYCPRSEHRSHILDWEIVDNVCLNWTGINMWYLLNCYLWCLNHCAISQNNQLYFTTMQMNVLLMRVWSLQTLWYKINVKKKSVVKVILIEFFVHMILKLDCDIHATA